MSSNGQSESKSERRAARVRVPQRTDPLSVGHSRGQVGQETSSRNSEVIHSGIYYPTDSLKTALCIRGRDLLYERCREQGIGFRQTGKLIVATDESQVPYLRKLYKRSETLKQGGDSPVPLEWLTGEQIRALEPDIGDQVVGGLLSPKTGIVSSHEYMESMEKSTCW